ncbi:hypothetical protein HDV04_003228 [Boothiomyces sp. JEL0838]|nr:hypothetical protein HDV04_003228 [Boothiomyces sp. JEL0838]
MDLQAIKSLYLFDYISSVCLQVGYILLMRKLIDNQKKSRLALGLLAFPLFYIAATVIVSILGAIIPQIGDGPSYTFWTLDIVALLFAQKYTSKTTEPQKRKSKVSVTDSKQRSVRDSIRQSVSDKENK